MRNVYLFSHCVGFLLFVSSSFHRDLNYTVVIMVAIIAIIFNFTFISLMIADFMNICERACMYTTIYYYDIVFRYQRFCLPFRFRRANTCPTHSRKRWLTERHCYCCFVVAYNEKSFVMHTHFQPYIVLYEKQEINCMYGD